jgi:YD repeat-containing protein
MRTFKYKLLVFLPLIMPLLLRAQTTPDYRNLIDVLPPSPNSASLGKYGGLNVGLASGMVNIDIPFREFSSNNLTVPLSLNYSSNGLKVDEIASRAGMSWVLNSGGVITRTVMGNIDESTTRISPPSDFPQLTQNLINFADELQNTSADGQPDIFAFNFNGHTGQFVLDSNRMPVLLTYSSIKIENNFNAAAEWNFKVTTPEGIQYFFGGPAATEKSNRYQSCTRIFPTSAPTAWYLNRIIHPNKDTVSFTYAATSFIYETGINQTLYSSVVGKSIQAGSQDGGAGPAQTLRTCTQSVSTTSPLLTGISSTAGGLIKFIYIDRPDNIGDKLLSRIEYYQPNNPSLYKFYTLNYQTVRSSEVSSQFPSDTSLRYRPFLVRIDEGNPVNSQLKTHLFTYNNLANLPVRLSFSQDDYGYYNGARNSTLIPAIPDPTWAHYFPGYDVADRSSHPDYSMNGTLAKIQYPTGGSDSLLYEGNSYYTTIQHQDIESTNVSGSGTGQIGFVTYKSDFFKLKHTTSAQATVTAGCTFDTSLGYTYDPIHNKAEIMVIDSASNNIVFDQYVIKDQLISSQDNIFVALNSGHTYFLQIIPRGAGVRAQLQLTYTDGMLPPTYANLTAGGLRIKQVITTARPLDNNPQIKHYYYYNPATPSQSSGSFIYQPVYYKFLRLFVPAQQSDGGSPSGASFCAPNEYDYYTMYSSSIYNLYAYPAPMYYSCVMESDGDNFLNGGIEHHYNLSPDLLSTSIIGDPIQSAPYSSYSWKNGLETYTCTFRMSGTTQVPVKKVLTHYNIDPRINKEFVSYIVNRKYSAVCQLTPPSQTQFNAYDIASYSHFQRWVYPDTVTTMTYDQTGQNYVTQTNLSTYGSTVHAMLTKTTATKSDGRLLTSRLIYPGDTTLTGDEETGRQALITNYMIGMPIMQQQYINGAAINREKTSYHVFPSGLVLPQTYNIQVLNNPAEDRVKFNNYTNFGKLLNQSIFTGPPTSYQWGYNNLYPVAACKNAANNDIFYDSFEEGDGNSMAGDAKTGHYSYKGPYSKTLSGLDTGAYILSYWLESSPGTWSFVSTKVAVSGSSYAIGPISGQIDDVRFYPAHALMTTYTYDPLIGLTSSTDPKGEPTYYEYDNFQRLMNVRDKDSNLVKHIEYHYQNQ